MHNIINEKEGTSRQILKTLKIMVVLSVSLGDRTDCHKLGG